MRCHSFCVIINNKDIMKKYYFKPETEIVDIEVENVILAGSENDSEPTNTDGNWDPTAPNPDDEEVW